MIRPLLRRTCVARRCCCLGHIAAILVNDDPDFEGSMAISVQLAFGASRLVRHGSSHSTYPFQFIHLTYISYHMDTICQVNNLFSHAIAFCRN